MCISHGFGIQRSSQQQHTIKMRSTELGEMNSVFAILQKVPQQERMGRANIWTDHSCLVVSESISNQRIPCQRSEGDREIERKKTCTDLVCVWVWMYSVCISVGGLRSGFFFFEFIFIFQCVFSLAILSFTLISNFISIDSFRRTGKQYSSRTRELSIHFHLFSEFGVNNLLFVLLLLFSIWFVFFFAAQLDGISLMGFGFYPQMPFTNQENTQSFCAARPRLSTIPKWNHYFVSYLRRRCGRTTDVSSKLN